MSSLPRFICPHCHTPVDPARMEVACHDRQEYRICPDCDDVIVWIVADSPEWHPSANAFSDCTACPA